MLLDRSHTTTASGRGFFRCEGRHLGSDRISAVRTLNLAEAAGLVSGGRDVLWQFRPLGVCLCMARAIHQAARIHAQDRLGLKLLPPSINEPGPAFVPQGPLIRVPLTRLKGLSQKTSDAMLKARQQSTFTSMADFFHRTSPAQEELEAMIRTGAFDEFSDTRTRQFWQAQHLIKTYGSEVEPNQGWLIPPAGLKQLPEIPLNEPTKRERLEWETELFGFAVSDHPLALFDDVDWNSYCPVNRLGEFVGETVTTCGLVVEQRTHHQITGEPMKFLSLADRTGIVETELFAQTYRNYALATVRYPVLEVEAKVEPFENGNGFSLRVMRAGLRCNGFLDQHLVSGLR